MILSTVKDSLQMNVSNDPRCHPDSEQNKGEENSWLRSEHRMKTFIIWLGIIILAFGLGFIVFNFFIMPKIVGAGKNVVVPNLIGKPLIEAQNMILAQKFTLGETKDIFDTTYSQGYVVGQKPIAGSIVKSGRTINLLVSKGPPKVRVPFLTAMTLEQGLRILASLGINPTAIESLRSLTIPLGKIIGLEPEPGSEIPMGSHLRVFVSSGISGIFSMPKLTGLPMSEAIDSIRINGLILSDIQTIPSDEQNGFVIAQYPEDGMKVKTNDSVRLIVSGRGK